MFFVLLLFEFNCSQKFFCSENEKVLISSKIFQVESSGEGYQVMNQIKNHLEFLQYVDLKLDGYDLIIGDSDENVQTILLLHFYDEQYLLQEIKIVQNTSQNQLSISTTVVNQQFLTIHAKCRHAYQNQNTVFILCEKEQKYLIYSLRKNNQQEKKQQTNLLTLLTSTEKLLKCKLNVQIYNRWIFVIWQTCFNWKAEVFELNLESNFLQLIKTISYIDSDYGALKNLEFSQYEFKIYLQFNHIINQIHLYDDEKTVLYQNLTYTLLHFKKKHDGLMLLMKNQLQDQKLLVEINSDAEQKSVIFFLQDDSTLQNAFLTADFTILQFDNYFSYYSYQTNKWEEYKKNFIKIQKSQMNQYLLGFDQSHLVLINQLKNNPLIDCDQLKDKNSILTQNQQSYHFSSIEEFNIEYLQKNVFRLIENSTLKNYQILYNGLPVQLILSQSSFLLGQPATLIPQNNFADIKITVINVDENNKIKCDLILQQILIWWHLLTIDENLIILYQNQTNFLFIQNCNYNVIQELGMFQQISNQITLFESNMFLLFFEEQQTIFYFEMNQKNGVQNKTSSNFLIYKRIYKLDFQVKQIYFERRKLHLVLKNCSEYVIGQDLKLERTQNNLRLYGNTIEEVCIRPFNFFLLKHSQSLFYYSDFIIKIQNLKVISILSFNEKLNILCILYFDEEVMIGQFYLLNNNLIKMFDFPKRDIQFVQPVTFTILNNYIAIYGLNTQTNVSQILVYKLFQNFQGCLKQIVETDSNFFQLIRLGQLFYQKDNQFKVCDIDKDYIKFEIKRFLDWNRLLNMTFKAVSKLNKSQELTFFFNLEIQNQDLSIYVHNQIQEIQMSDLVYFDPRIYTKGNIAFIKSNNSIISQAFIINDINQICFNYFQIICGQESNSNLKIFIESNFLLQYVYPQILDYFKSEQFVFIINTLPKFDFQIIEIYELQDDNRVTLFPSKIKLNQTQKLVNIIIVIPYIFLMFSNEVQIYQFNQQNIVYIYSLQITCRLCQIIKSQDDLLFFIHSNLFFNATLIHISNNLTSFQTDVQIIQDIKLKLNFNCFAIQILSISNIQNNQITLNSIYFELNIVAYATYVIIDLLNQSNSQYEILSYIRYPRGTIIQEYFILEKDVLIIKLLDSEPKNSLLFLYNISYIENYRVLDSIQELLVEGYSIHKYNSTSLMLISAKDGSKAQLLTFNSYQIQLNDISSNELHICYENQLKSTCQTFFLKRQESFIKFSQSLFILILLILTVTAFVLRKWYCASLQTKFKQTKEIEL